MSVSQLTSDRCEAGMVLAGFTIRFLRNSTLTSEGSAVYVLDCRNYSEMVVITVPEKSHKSGLNNHLFGKSGVSNPRKLKNYFTWGARWHTGTVLDGTSLIDHHWSLRSGALMSPLPVEQSNSTFVNRVACCPWILNSQKKKKSQELGQKKQCPCP